MTILTCRAIIVLISLKTAFLKYLRDERGKGGDPYRVVNVGGAKFELNAPEKHVNEIQIINLEPGTFEEPRWVHYLATCGVSKLLLG